MEVKKCSTCKNSLSIRLFSKNKSRPDGLNTNCKSCHKKYRDLYYKKNKERETSLARSYRSYPVSCTVCGKTVLRNPSQIESQQYFFCSRHCHSTMNGKGGINVVLQGCMKSAKMKHLEIDVDAGYLKELFKKQKERCALTDLPLQLATKNQRWKIYNRASLDRIDSKSGYIKGNVQFVALGINYMKNRYHQDDVIEMIRLLRT